MHSADNIDFILVWGNAKNVRSREAEGVIFAFVGSRREYGFVSRIGVADQEKDGSGAVDFSDWIVNGGCCYLVAFVRCIFRLAIWVFR